MFGIEFVGLLLRTNKLSYMYKPRTIPVLTGAAAERFNAMLHDGSLTDNSDYSDTYRDLETILTRSMQ